MRLQTWCIVHSFYVLLLIFVVLVLVIAWLFSLTRSSLYITVYFKLLDVTNWENTALLLSDYHNFSAKVK